MIAVQVMANVAVGTSAAPQVTVGFPAKFTHMRFGLPVGFIGSRPSAFKKDLSPARHTGELLFISSDIVANVFTNTKNGTGTFEQPQGRLRPALGPVNHWPTAHRAACQRATLAKVFPWPIGFQRAAKAFSISPASLTSFSDTPPSVWVLQMNVTRV